MRDDDSMRRPFNAPPIVVNYFFHEEITPSAKRSQTEYDGNPPRRQRPVRR